MVIETGFGGPDGDRGHTWSFMRNGSDRKAIESMEQ